MPAKPPRAVFTGLGVISSIGSEPDSLWQALKDGVCGVRKVSLFDPSRLSCQIAGEIPDFDAKKIVPKEVRKSLKVMARTVQMGVCAAHKAVVHAELAPGSIHPERFGVEFGCVMVATELEDLAQASRSSVSTENDLADLHTWGRDGIEHIPPLWMLKYLPNMPACHVSIQQNAQGPNNTITAGEVASTLAIGEAFRLLNRGDADAFLAGGCDSRLNPLSFTRFNLFCPLTKRNQEPAKAVRPFDRDRDGTALSEASATFLLETAGHAQKRGAKVYAELKGFASGFERKKDGRVLAQVIRNALADAGITPNEVDHINATAGGIVDQDRLEARAIAELFGDSVPVYAPRGHLGDAGAASGAIELAASVLALHHGELPGTINCDNLAPDCAGIQVHTGSPRPVTKPYAVKISLTNMGQCAVLVIGRAQNS